MFVLVLPQVLLPIIDLLNSSRENHSCELGFDSSGNLILVATKAIPKGLEVFINYGDKSDAELMALYGYSHDTSTAHLHVITEVEVIK